MPVRTVTLDADTPFTVTAPPGEFNAVGILVIDPAAATVHVGLTDTDPTPWADDTYAVPGGSRRVLSWGKGTGTSVRLFSTGSPRVEVEFS